MLSIKLLARTFLCSALIAATSAGGAESNISAETEQAQLAILPSDAPAADKALACKRLAIDGSSAAVADLAKLLPDAQLNSWARIALEAIPGAEADAALRKAAESLDGLLLVGTLNSIGVRRDAGSVEVLSQRLKHQDAEVASAAAVALGRIGNDAATKLLREALASAPVGVRSAVAEGCILCAERLWADGQGEEAARLYDEIRQADVPKPRILEATRGAILARKEAGIPLLVEQLHSEDRDTFRIAVTAARELAGPEVLDTLAAELAKATPERSAPLLYALADRGDKRAIPAILQAAQNGPPPVRVAAISVLKNVGDASCVATLLEIALGDDATVAQAARETLAGLVGKDIDADIAGRLAKAEAKSLPLLLELVGQRRISALDELRKAADHASPQVRAAALTALGETVGPEELTLLISRVATPKNPTDAPVAQQALRAAAVRMPDREACAKQLVAAMANAPAAVKNSLLEILGEVGGQQALQAMRTAAIGNDAQLQDTASRLLGAWFDVDAGPVLLELAKMPSNQYNVRALRGYIRLARQFTMDDSQRAAMCRNALQATNRPAEQKLVLEVVERYPSAEMLKVAVEAAAIPALKEDATRVALAVAQKVTGNASDIQQLLAQIGQGPVKLEIIKAEYGAGTKQRDVTEIIRKQARDLPLIVLPSANYNAAFGGDPVPDTVKQLKIQYRINGKAGEATFAENAVILLPR